MKRLILALLAVILLLPSSALAASYVFSPSGSSVVSGQTFTVQVNVAASDQAVNAVSAEIAFPVEVLQVVSVSRANSIVSIWVKEPSFSNTSGIIRFEGAILNPGYQGPAGRLVSITFRAVGGGTAGVNFRSGSILANDGKGTNVISGLASARYTITTPATPAPAPAPKTTNTTQQIARPVQIGDITSETHPSADTWSRSSSAQFSWLLPSDATAVQYGLDRSATGQPGASTAGRVDSVTLPLDGYADDGAYYFHLRYRTGDEPGQVQTRRILVDRVPPERFEVSEVETGDPTEPRREIRVEALDASSGVDHIQVSWNGGSLRVPAAQMGRFILPALPPGTHDITLRAVDKAGNGRIAHAFIRIEPLEPPTLEIQKIEEGRAWLLEKQNVFEPVVFGEAPQGKDVIVRFVPRGGEPREVIAPVADDGTWRLAYAPLALGSWQITATARDERGALSSPVGPLKISSDTPWTMFMSTLPWIIVLTLAIALLYVLRRRRMAIVTVPVPPQV